MTPQAETVAERDCRFVRASHAKSLACVLAELKVAANLPPDLTQGFSATPTPYCAAVRFAQGPGEILGDRVSTHRGMTIKIFDVRGDKLAISI